MSSAPTSEVADPEVAIARLRRRLDRERNARRQAEEISERGLRDLWLANRELDERVEERTRDLTNALEDLRIASSARERFLSTLSHEMRTPLNGVMGMIELLGPHLVGDQGRRYLAVASESADRLFTLVTRLLDMVELDSGSFTTHCTSVAVDHLAEQVRDRWQMEALRGGFLLTITSQGRPDCVIDEPRVVQILDELIDNALTHATPGAIRLEFTSTDEGFSVSVADSGPGIAPDRIPELLNSDLAILDDSTERAAQGLGVGLGICRRIAEAIGGTLTLSSDGKTSSEATLAVPIETQKI